MSGTQVDPGTADDIAVVGMSGRFPGARTVAALWENVRAGKVSVEPVSEAALVAAGVPGDDLHDPAYVRCAATMPDADRFDAAFFGYSPREASYIDPQQRVLLECAWSALEDAGLSRRSYPFPVGVFAGSSLNTYLLETGLARRLAREFVLMLSSSDKDFLATRIAYKLNLSGPAITVQTACSTSLVAVHLACQALLDRECDLALAGGVAVKVPLSAGYFWQQGGIVSRDGQVRSFDAAASGTVFGSGAGIAVLKRLDDALADDDPIRAVIKGSAVNNDGNEKASFTAPSVDRQAEAVIDALARAGLPSSAIDYLEAHGTGTALGDPIEFEALCKAFGDGARSHKCAIGSVKPNVGHLEAAAGIAGLIKVVLALEHAEIPRLANFELANPACDFDASPFYVPTRAEKWPGDDGPRRAGVSALGVGGTNAHVVLEEAPLRASRGAASTTGAWTVLPVSARTESSLTRARQQLADALESAPTDFHLGDVAHTLQSGRCEFGWRTAVVAADLAEAASALRTAAGTQAAVRRPRRVVLVVPDAFDLTGKHRTELLEMTAAADPSVDVLRERWADLGLVADEIRTERELGDVAGLIAVVLGRASSVAARRDATNVVSVATIPEDGTSLVRAMCTGIAAVWEAGGPIDWARHQSGRGARLVRLPTYPFEPVRHWYVDSAW